MKHSLIITLGATSLLVACGGGGGGLGNGNQPSAMVPISAANAVSVTKSSYQSALASASIGELSGETGIIAAAPGGVSKLSSIAGVSSKSGSGNAQVPIPATESPCDVSGSVTISGRIEDVVTPSLSPGDYFDIKFKRCVNLPGEETHGDLHFDVDAFSGDFLGGLYDMTMTLELDRFRVTTGNDVITSNGGATVTLNTANSPSVSTSVNGSSMTVDTNTSSETLFNFASAQTLDGGLFPAPFTMTASGTLDTSQIGGSVRYSTPVMFEGLDGDYPGIGELLVTGANSSVRLIAESNVDVRIELDTDADGTIDETINMTWAELDN